MLRIGYPIGASFAGLLAIATPTSAWAACTITNTGPTALGTYSSPALQKNAPPYTSVPGGFDCPDPLVSLLGSNDLSVTATSATNFTLTSTTTSSTANYVVAADNAGANAFTPGVSFVYMQGLGINLLGLLGNSVRNVQVYVKPSATADVAAGTYTGSFQLAWEWKICTVVVLGLCSEYDNSNRTGVIKVATVAVTMVVKPKAVDVQITTITTWDPASRTNNPRAVPGSKQRTAITLTNTDIIAVDANSIVVNLPTPARGTVALDGDGTTSTAFLTTPPAMPPSSLTATYTAPANTTDDVDFSANNGVDWSYDPSATPKAVTNVRVRPRGTMAAGSKFVVTLPYVLF